MIYPHTVEEHGKWEQYRGDEGYHKYICSECGFCQCEELEGLHATNCIDYDHSGAGDGYREED